MKTSAISNIAAGLRSAARSIFAVKGRSAYVMLPFLGTGYSSIGTRNGDVQVYREGGQSLTIELRGLQVVVDSRGGAPVWLAWPALIITSIAMLILWPEHWSVAWRELSDPAPRESDDAVPAAS